MAINKVVYGDDVLVDLTPTTAEAEDVIEGKLFVNKNGILTQGTNEGGSKDYEELDNKPSINNVELVGNKTTSDLGIVIPTVPTNLSSFTDDLGSNPTHTHSQYLTSETEPMFNSSVAKGITSSDITNWNNKSTFSGNYNDLTNKPSIPSQLSELSDDTTHRVVTDSEKTIWNSKSDFSGSYNDLTNKPTIPSALSDLTDDTTHRVVTDTEKTTWNNKSNFSGNYNDLTNKPKIPSQLSELSDDSSHRLVSDTEKSNWNAKSDFSGDYDDLDNKPTLFSGDYNDLTNKPTIPTVPTNVSAFTNDSGYISGLVMLEYGTSTWQEFQNAFNSNKIVYCKVGGRMAFLAYISTSNVEFQYYRSLSSPTISSQPDEVYVYTLKNNNTWTTTTRKASSTIAVGTGLNRSYTASSRTMTLSVDTSTIATKQYVDDTLGDIETLLGGI